MQENGRLSLIADDFKGQKMVLSLSDFKLEGANSSSIKFRELGKAQATTFFGFCKKHDSELFSEIENTELDTNSSQHLFLHSYRSYASSLHQAKQIFKGISDNHQFVQTLPDRAKFVGLEKQVESEIKFFESYQPILNYALRNKHYGILRHYVHSLPYLIPIGTYGVVSPARTPEGNLLNFQNELPIIIITILPSSNRTDVILSTFENNKSGKLFLNELKNFNSAKIQLVISNLALYYTDSTVLSPKIWNKFNLEEKTKLENMITYGRYTDVKNRNTDFFKLDINIFSQRFKKGTN